MAGNLFSKGTIIGLGYLPDEGTLTIHVYLLYKGTLLILGI